MIKFHKLVIFLEGFAVGLIGSHVIKKYPILYSPSKITLDEAKRFTDDICDGYNEYEKVIDDSYGSKSFEIELSKKNINSDRVECRDNKKDVNDVDFKNVSGKFNSSSVELTVDGDKLQQTSYTSIVSEEDIKEMVEGELHLVDESDLYREPTSFKKEIKKIKFMDVLHAAEKDCIFVIFDPKTKTFRYLYDSKDIISYYKACTMFTKNVIDNVLKESEYNANGWVQPLYLYNYKINKYLILETRESD